jgi:hypothetical protein
MADFPCDVKNTIGNAAKQCQQQKHFRQSHIASLLSPEVSGGVTSKKPPSRHLFYNLCKTRIPARSVQPPAFEATPIGRVNTLQLQDIILSVKRQHPQETGSLRVLPR